MVDYKKVNFFIILTGLAKASPVSEGCFEPDLAFDMLVYFINLSQCECHD
jgi:hypothetical protein